MNNDQIATEMKLVFVDLRKVEDLLDTMMNKQPENHRWDCEAGLARKDLNSALGTLNLLFDRLKRR